MIAPKYWRDGLRVRSGMYGDGIAHGVRLNPFQVQVYWERSGFFRWVDADTLFNEIDHAQLFTPDAEEDQRATS